MLGKSILLRTSCTDTDRKASALLRAAGNEVISEAKVPRCLGVLEAGGVDLAILDGGDGADLGGLSDEAYRRGVPVIVLTAALDSEGLEMFCDGRANHLIYGEGRIDAAVVTAEKLLREVLFGLDKYVSRFGVETYKFEVSSGASLRAALECFDEFLSMLGCSAAIAAELTQLAGELGENALYSAPRTEAGRRRYKPVDRQQGDEVDPWERAQLSYAFDGQRILLSVTDNFGSLEPARVRNTLGRTRSRAQTNPGRLLHSRQGRGLRSAWNSSDELIFNIAPGSCTEVIAIRELTGAPSRCGLHMHFDGVLERKTTAVANTIRVSDSMLVDIRQHIAHRKAPPAVVLPLKRRSPKFRDDTLTDPLVKVLPADDAPMGIDTLLGLLHGATSLQRSLEIGLRFMTVCYGGAIAYTVREDALAPVLGAGDIANWPELQRMDLNLYDDCKLADLARSGISARYRPSRSYELDRTLTKFTSGESSPVGYVITVELQDEPRFALFAFGPKYGKHIADKVVRPFERKLTASIAKHLGVEQISTTRRQSTGG